MESLLETAKARSVNAAQVDATKLQVMNHPNHPLGVLLRGLRDAGGGTADRSGVVSTRL